MKSKKKIIILIVILIIVVSLGVYFYLLNRDVKDTTNANMNFTINDTLSDGEGKRVKVFLLAGQSNASGASSVEELKKNISNEDYLKYEQGFNNIYINYFNDNGSNFSNGFVNVKLDQGCAGGHFGPELGMGEELSKLYPNEIIFIIKYAWGGTNLHTQWDSNNGHLYKAFIKFVKESMEYLKSKNFDAEIVSMMWMQGESDSTLFHALKYKNNLLDMLSSVREDLNVYVKESGMYFVDAYISSSYYWIHYKLVNKAKQNVCDISALNVCINTIEEGLTYDREPEGNPDLAHYDSISELKLGHLFVKYYNDLTN